MTQNQLFFQALANIEEAISNILDSLDVCTDFIEGDSSFKKVFEKEKEYDEIKKELGDDDDSPYLKKKRYEIIKLKDEYQAEQGSRTILCTSTFLYMYTIFENHNNKLIEIAENSSVEIKGKIIDYFTDLCMEKKIPDADKLLKQFQKNDDENRSKYILRQPDLFEKYIHFFDYKNTFEHKVNTNRCLNLLDYHREIKIRRNLLTHNSVEDFDIYKNELISKRGLINPVKRKKIINHIFGVNDLKKLEELYRPIEPDIFYLKICASVLIEISLIFFYNSFSHTINLNDFVGDDDDQKKIDSHKLQLFGGIINRLNFSYNNLNLSQFTTIHGLISILFLHEKTIKGKLPLYDSNLYNNGYIPWMDYINRCLFLKTVKEKNDLNIISITKILSTEKDAKKKKDLSHIIKILKDKNIDYGDEMDKKIKIIKKSNVDENALGMFNSFCENDGLVFIKYFLNYHKKLHKSEGEKKPFQEYLIRQKIEAKNSWFMVKYLIDKKDNKVVEFFDS